MRPAAGGRRPAGPVPDGDAEGGSSAAIVCHRTCPRGTTEAPLPSDDLATRPRGANGKRPEAETVVRRLPTPWSPERETWLRRLGGLTGRAGCHVARNARGSARDVDRDITVLPGSRMRGDAPPPWSGTPSADGDGAKPCGGIAALNSLRSLHEAPFIDAWGLTRGQRSPAPRCQRSSPLEWPSDRAALRCDEL